MNDRRLSDAQIAAALRAHLPAQAQAGLPRRVMDAVESASQRRALPSFLGALSDADPVGARRSLLIAAALLLALALASAAAVGAWRLLQRDTTPHLDLTPPADIAAFVLSTYDRMPDLPPVAITTLTDGSVKGRIYVDRSGAVRFEHYATPDAPEPDTYEILSGTTMGQLATVGSTKEWVEQAGVISGDPRVFLLAEMDGGGPDNQPGCGVTRDQGEVGDGTAASGWTYVATESVAGRPTFHVTCAGWDLWIDVETRLILRSRGLVQNAAFQGVGRQPFPALPQAIDLSQAIETIEVTDLEFGEQPADLFELAPPAGVAAMSTGWTATGTMATPRSGHTATLLPDGKVLVAGGKSGNVALASAELYDPNTGTWTATGTMVTPRSGHTATLLPSGKVLVAGGGNDLNASAELYDPGTGTWTVTGNMAAARSGHTATLLPDGKVLVTGGFDITKPPGIGGGPEIVASAELYDPSSGTWSATGTMSTSRRDHTATLLPDGTVLVVGGYRNANPGGDERGPEPLDTAELYHPLRGVWTATGSTDGPFTDQGATLLADGKVLVEYGESELVNLYDPGTGVWADVPFPDLGGFVTATLLRDGTVLSTFADRDVELYDPATGSWDYMNAGSITFGVGATATLLHDGTVLVAGGETDAGGDTNAAEVYHPGSTK